MPLGPFAFPVGNCLLVGLPDWRVCPYAQKLLMAGKLRGLSRGHAMQSLGVSAYTQHPCAKHQAQIALCRHNHLPGQGEIKLARICPGSEREKYFFFPFECGRPSTGNATGPGGSTVLWDHCFRALKNISNRAYANNVFIHSTLHIRKRTEVFRGVVNVTVSATNFYLLGNTLKTFQRLQPNSFRKEF